MWHIYIACFFDTNFEGKTSQIERLFESNLRSFDCSKCSTVIWLPLDPSCKGNSLTRAGHFRSRLSPDAQNRAFAKKQKLHSNPRYGPVISIHFSQLPEVIAPSKNAFQNCSFKKKTL